MPLPEPPTAHLSWLLCRGLLEPVPSPSPPPGEPGPGRAHLPGGLPSEEGPGAPRPWPAAGRLRGAVLLGVLQVLQAQPGEATGPQQTMQISPLIGRGGVAGAQLPGPISPNVRVLTPQSLLKTKSTHALKTNRSALRPFLQNLAAATPELCSAGPRSPDTVVSPE